MRTQFILGASSTLLLALAGVSSALPFPGLEARVYVVSKFHEHKDATRSLLERGLDRQLSGISLKDREANNDGENKHDKLADWDKKHPGNGVLRSSQPSEPRDEPLLRERDLETREAEAEAEADPFLSHVIDKAKEWRAKHKAKHSGGGDTTESTQPEKRGIRSWLRKHLGGGNSNNNNNNAAPSSDSEIVARDYDMQLTARDEFSHLLKVRDEYNQQLKTRDSENMKRSQPLGKRNFKSWIHKIGHGIKNGFNSAVNAVKNVAGKVIGGVTGLISGKATDMAAGAMGMPAPVA